MVNMLYLEMVADAMRVATALKWVTDFADKTCEILKSIIDFIAEQRCCDQRQHLLNHMQR